MKLKLRRKRVWSWPLFGLMMSCFIIGFSTAHAQSAKNTAAAAGKDAKAAVDKTKDAVKKTGDAAKDAVKKSGAAIKKAGKNAVKQTQKAAKKTQDKAEKNLEKAFENSVKNGKNTESATPAKTNLTPANTAPAKLRSGQQVPSPAKDPWATPVDKDGKPKNIYGIGIRGAALFIPEFLLTGLFFEEAEGMINWGAALEFIIRTPGDVEYAFGVGYHRLNFEDNVDRDGNIIPHSFLNKGDASFEREFVTSDLSYLSIDVRFLKIFPINNWFKIELGGGIGVGVLFGKFTRTDTFIESYNPSKEDAYKQAFRDWKKDKRNKKLDNQTCKSRSDGGDCNLHEGLSLEEGIKNHNESQTPLGRREDRIPPVIPIVDLVFGFVFQPHPRWDIRIQGVVGVPRIFWVGISTHVYFW